MAFDPTHPIHDGLPESDPVRENFVQLAAHHKGATEPPAKAAGFIWWDTSDPANEKLRAYTGSGWVDLFEHMESTPKPAVGGAASWQGYVKDKDLTDPPGAPSTGDRYIVASVATGDWVGEEDNIAEWDGAAWIFSVPTGGWTVWVEDEGEIYVFNGASWGQESLGPHAATHRGGGSDEIDEAETFRAGLMSASDKERVAFQLPPYICIADEKSVGVNGGDFYGYDWRTRDLNVIRVDTGGWCLGLSSNQFTLGKGKYAFRISSPAYMVGSHKARLWNVSDSGVVEEGSSEYADAGGYAGATRSIIVGYFVVLTDPKTFEVQHYGYNDQYTDGFGKAASIGTKEVYTLVELFRLVE